MPKYAIFWSIVKTLFLLNSDEYSDLIAYIKKTVHSYRNLISRLQNELFINLNNKQ